MIEYDTLIKKGFLLQNKLLLFDEAYKCFLEASILQPSNYLAFYYMGQAQMKLSNYNEALVNMNMASNLCSTNARMRILLHIEAIQRIQLEEKCTPSHDEILEQISSKVQFLQMGSIDSLSSIQWNALAEHLHSAGYLFASRYAKKQGLIKEKEENSICLMS